jgi:anti-anti-sigma factor
MEISTEWQDGTLIANVGDRIDGTEAREFQETLAAEIDDDLKGMVLDFEQLNYISSAGLRVILLTARVLQRQGGKLAICSLSDSIREVFEISGFDKIIPVHSTREEAASAIGA